MLRAFDIIENEQLALNLVDSAFQLEERNIAREYIADTKIEKIKSLCPVCGGDSLVHFAEIEGVEYLRCTGCWTVFVPVSGSVSENYQNNPKLLEMRRSARYQELAASKRAKLWGETLFWLQFRALRYLGRNAGLKVRDWGNFYSGWRSLISNSTLCAEYSSVTPVLGNTGPLEPECDVLLYTDRLRNESLPLQRLKSLRTMLSRDGILVISSRVSSGFDILTLRENSGIYPYECVMLPSVYALEILLNKAGFEILECTTPGTLDIQGVCANKEALKDNNLFVEYLLNKTSAHALKEFQSFLQKHALSSYCRLIAKKMNNNRIRKI